MDHAGQVWCVRRSDRLLLTVAAVPAAGTYTLQYEMLKSDGKRFQSLFYAIPILVL